MKGARGREPKVLENEDRREHKTGPEKLKGRNKKGEGAIEKKKGRLGGENTKIGKKKRPGRSGRNKSLRAGTPKAR
jgi:hypothetical protein